LASEEELHLCIKTFAVEQSQSAKRNLNVLGEGFRIEVKQEGTRMTAMVVFCWQHKKRCCPRVVQVRAAVRLQ
jgi:hypothetical protein